MEPSQYLSEKAIKWGRGWGGWAKTTAITVDAYYMYKSVHDKR